MSGKAKNDPEQKKVTQQKSHVRGEMLLRRLKVNSEQSAQRLQLLPRCPQIPLVSPWAMPKRTPDSIANVRFQPQPRRF